MQRVSTKDGRVEFYKRFKLQKYSSRLIIRKPDHNVAHYVYLLQLELSDAYRQLEKMIIRLNGA
jgi:hypothetical protein